MKRLCLLFLLVIASFAEITVVGRLDGFTNMRAAYHYDGLVYVLTGRELVVVDPELPTPSRIGSIGFDGFAMKAAFDGDYAFVVQGNELSIIDISDPTAPSLLDSYRLSNYGYDIDMTRTHIFVASLDALDIFSMDSVYDIELIHSISSSIGQCKSVAVRGDFLMMGRSELGIAFYDISNPRSPASRGNANTPGWVLDIEIEGDYAFVADGSMVGIGNGSMVTIDLTTGPMFSVIDTFVSVGGNCFEGTIVYRDYYILADGTSLKILDISSPADGASLLAEMPAPDGVRINNVDFHDGYIYIAGSTELIIATSDVIAEGSDETPPEVIIIEPVDGSVTTCISHTIRIELRDDSGIDWDRLVFTVNDFEMTGDDIPRIGDEINYSPWIEWAPGPNFFSVSNVCDTEGNCLPEPVRATFIMDYDAPIATANRPEDGSTVTTATPLIQATLVDRTSHIDPYSIRFTYTINDIHTVLGRYPDDVSWDGTNATITTAAPFTDGYFVEVLFIFADAVDYCDPHVSSHSWTFRISLDADTDPPTVTLAYPLSGAFISDPLQEISYEITDRSGVDPATLILEVNGTEYTVDSPSLSFESDILTYTPVSSWAEGVLNTASLLQYGDLVGNVSTEAIATSFTADYTPPYIAWTYPEDGATDIGSTSSIQIAIYDAISGFDMSALVMTINDSVVSPVFTPVPGDSGRIVTYVPTTHYSSETVIVCLENIADRVTLGEPNSYDTCFTFYTDAVLESKPEAISFVEISPNPFNSALSIAFDAQGETIVDIFDIRGKFICNMHNGNLEGQNEIIWHSEEDSGIYIIRIVTGGVVHHKRALLIK